MVTMLYHRKLDDTWKEAARQLRATLQASATKLSDRDLSIIGRSRGQKVELDASHVIESFNVNGRRYSYKQVRLWLLSAACLPTSWTQSTSR